MTTAICFDLDGTLLRFEDDFAAVVRTAIAPHLDDDADLDAAATAYQEAFLPAFRSLAADPYHTGMAAAAEAVGADADPDAMVDSLLEAEQGATTVPDGAREVLPDLAADATLGVVTNGRPDWQAAKLAHHGLAEHFDAVVTSYEAGAHKPDPAPFELARERLPADEYAMVGDDYEADVEGARAAGFVPVHYEADADGPSFWATLRAMV